MSKVVMRKGNTMNVRSCLACGTPVEGRYPFYVCPKDNRFLHPRDTGIMITCEVADCAHRFWLIKEREHAHKCIDHATEARKGA